VIRRVIFFPGIEHRMRIIQIMNILFLSLSDELYKDDQGIYIDLMKSFANHGHKMYAVAPIERRERQKTTIVEKNGIKVLCVRIGNITKTNSIEKGISTLLIEHQYTRAIRKKFSLIKFDAIIYSTPPITLVKTVEYFKKRDNAKTYLLLKDIFPQNAVDLGLLKQDGVMGVLYKFFRNKEKSLYNISDYIGCMSEANVEYVLQHNLEVSPQKIHVCPNCMENHTHQICTQDVKELKQKYDIPPNCISFIYGGSLGLPQDISFILECLRENMNIPDRFFTICGGGTGYEKIKTFIDHYKPTNVRLVKYLPRDEYEEFVKAFDVGLIFLDHRFTIPNFPSRLLSYMQNGMPVIACTDKNTDLRSILVNERIGWWIESTDAKRFKLLIDKIIKEDLSDYCVRSYDYFVNNFTVDKGYQIIIQRLQG